MCIYREKGIVIKNTPSEVEYNHHKTIEGPLTGIKIERKSPRGCVMKLPLPEKDAVVLSANNRNGKIIHKKVKAILSLVECLVIFFNPVTRERNLLMIAKISPDKMNNKRKSIKALKTLNIPEGWGVSSKNRKNMG